MPLHETHLDLLRQDASLRYTVGLYRADSEATGTGNPSIQAGLGKGTDTFSYGHVPTIRNNDRQRKPGGGQSRSHHGFPDGMDTSKATISVKRLVCDEICVTHFK
jgi:hypothetical protein